MSWSIQQVARMAKVIAGETDEADALRRHHAALVAEGERLSRLADTVARTLATYETGQDMPADQLFDGFSDRTAQLEEDLVAQHGEGVREHFARSREVSGGFTREDLAQVEAQWSALDDQLVEVMRSARRPTTRARSRCSTISRQRSTGCGTPAAPPMSRTRSTTGPRRLHRRRRRPLPAGAAALTGS